jgi:tetratricopeptide (TPR) repeat protein
MRRELLTCLLLALLTLLAYGPVLRCSFVNYDDPVYVWGNPHVEAGLSAAALRWDCSTLHASNWHPLTWLSLQLDATLFGTDPWGFHFTNLVLHLASTLLLFLFFRWTTSALWPSALVAALFAVHPLHVESVAWVAERKDVLSGLFWMLTLLAYAWYVQRANLPRYALVLGVFALGLLAKPMLVTLPCVLLLLDSWPLERKESVRRLVLEKLPLLGLALASCALTVYAQQHGGAVKSLAQVPPGARLANAVLSYGRYLEQAVLFRGLAPFYPYPNPGHLFLPALVSALVLLAITAVAVTTRRSRPYLLVGWLWYLGTLVPVIGLVQVGRQAMADRYTYLPLVGVFLMVAWEAVHWTKRRPGGRLIGSVVAVAVLLVCVAATRAQVGYWQDSERLWQHTLEVTGDNALAHVNLGHILAREGKQNEALAHYREAVRTDPQFDPAQINLARALWRCGLRDEAQKHVDEALRLNPESAPAHQTLAEILVERGDHDEAVRQLRLALQIDAEYAAAHNTLGVQLEKQGKLEESMAEYRQASALDPGDAAPLINLGKAYEKRGQATDAVRCYEAGLRLDPYADMAHINLGTLLEKGQQIALAVSHYEAALRINPHSAKAHYNLGTLLGKQGKLDRAIPHLREAVTLDPQYARAHFNLGFALEQTGKTDEALVHLQRAVQLDPQVTQYRLALAHVLRKVGRSSEAVELEGKTSGDRR